MNDNLKELIKATRLLLADTENRRQALQRQEQDLREQLAAYEARLNMQSAATAQAQTTLQLEQPEYNAVLGPNKQTPLFSGYGRVKTAVRYVYENTRGPLTIRAGGEKLAKLLADLRDPEISFRNATRQLEDDGSVIKHSYGHYIFKRS